MHQHNPPGLRAALSATVLALLLGACATAPGPGAGTAATPAPAGGLDAIIAEAEQEIAQAEKMKATWRDTEKFLKEAKDLKKAGDIPGATQLARKALSQARLAQDQARAEAGAKPYYPK